MSGLKVKRSIDRVVGGTLCAFLSPFACLSRRMNRFATGSSDVHRIVVAKYYGLGSIIHSTGLLRELRKVYPSATIVYLTRKSNAALLRSITTVDETMTIDDSSMIGLLKSTVSIMFKMWRRRADLFFDLEVFSHYGTLVGFLSRPRLLCGLSAGFKDILCDHVAYMNMNVPIRSLYLLLGKSVGVPPDASSDLDELMVNDPDTRRRTEECVRKIDPDFDSGRRIAVNVNASELSYARRWSPDRFVDVCRIYAERGFRMYLVGSPGERQYVQSVRDRLPPDAAVFNIAGSLPFTEFLCFLGGCDALLTNDTGIMNIGFALRVPTLSLFGPGNPLQYHVDSNVTRYLRVPVCCSPCVYGTGRLLCESAGHSVCMDMITVDAVVRELDALLSVHGPFSPVPNAHDAIPVAGKLPLGVLR